jgi:hypothetical protein
MFEHRGSKFRIVRRVVGFAVVGILAVAALGYVVMSLWNGLLPPILGVKTIHFWQAMGLLVLARILFGGFSHRHSGHWGHRRRMLERWERMSPEDREKFKEGMRGRWCGIEKPHRV